MQTQVEYVSPTKVKLTVEADARELSLFKDTALGRLSSTLKVPGFRPGKVPAQVAEKHLDANQLSEETLELAVNELYARALITNQVRAVASPEIKVLAYVPFEQLSFEAHLEAIGQVKLAKYSGLNVTKPTVKISAVEINAVLARLQKQMAERREVKRAAKTGDEVVIDFSGHDALTKEAVSGASGRDYPLELGSGSFIPGFESELVGLKPGDEKSFELSFPGDYSVRYLRNKKVEFKATIKKVNALKITKIDDQFAAAVGPFKTLSELKADIKKQLSASHEAEAKQRYQNDLVLQIVAGSEVAIPEGLVSDEVGRFERDQRQSAAYNGLTWKEFLTNEGLNEESFAKLAAEQASQRVKAGLILGEIASVEKISVTEQELAERVQSLKQNYAGDAAMQQELTKEANVQDIKNRFLVEKTISRLEELNR